MKKSTKSLALALVAITIAVGGSLAAMSALGILPFASVGMLPGFEGMNAQVAGIQIGGSFFQNTAGGTLPTNYYWANNDARNPILGKDTGYTTPGEVKVSTRDPYPAVDQFTTGKTVEYWVNGTDGKFYHVKGEIVIYSLPLDVKSVQTGWDTLAGQYPAIFMGEKVWIHISSQTWNQAYQEQSPVSGQPSYMGQAWEAPLLVVISDYSLESSSFHDQLAPVEEGHQFTLYASPSQVNQMANISIESYLASMPTLSAIKPDSRMQSDAYFAIDLTNFGEQVVNGGTWPFGYVVNPVGHYAMKIYAIRLGVFTYLSPDDTIWAQEGSETIKPWWETMGDAWAGWWANPVNWVSLFIFVGMITAIVVIIFLLYAGALKLRRAGKGAAK